MQAKLINKIIYEFMISTISSKKINGEGNMLFEMRDKDGNMTGHLNGFIYKTLNMLETGIKPIYVFDGIAPEMKRNELKKRKE